MALAFLGSSTDGAGGVKRRSRRGSHVVEAAESRTATGVWGRLGEREAPLAELPGRSALVGLGGPGLGSCLVGTWWIWFVALASLPGPRLSLASLGKLMSRLCQVFHVSVPVHPSALPCATMAGHRGTWQVTDKIQIFIH
jgi:hypothetical protein